MPKTYTVRVQADAFRTITVRADSAREAVDLAASRIRPRSGSWFINFSGSPDEHFAVEVDGVPVGPWLSTGPDGVDVRYDDE
jgi:hypothetical protein